MYFVLTAICSILFGTNIVYVQSWDLSEIIDHRNYSVRHVSLFYIRAFLCISRQSSDNYTMPTLIETNWPENLLPTAPKIFPDIDSHSKVCSSCNGILDVVATDVDQFHGHLWIIDNGSSDHCPPKLIVYDLFRLNEEIHRFTFKNLPSGAFTSIKVHPESKATVNNTFVLLTLGNESNYLIIYSMNDRKWWRLVLLTDQLIVVPKELTFRKNKHLFIADEFGQLWMTKLNIGKPFRATSSYLTANVTFMENLLGPAKALTTDPKDFLYYYLPRDGAIVRWNSRKTLNAENHDVLYLSSITIAQIIFGAKGSVWIVQETPDENGDHCRRILYHFSLSSQLQ